jgi:hypothetical protein
MNDVSSLRSRSAAPAASAVVDLVPPASLPKAPTGISGLDEITLGGLPRCRRRA